MNRAIKFATSMTATGAAVLLVAAGMPRWIGEACAASSPPPISFSQDVQPLLQFRCGSCHMPGGEGSAKSGFEVSSYETVMKGTKFGQVIIPGKPDESSLMRLLDWRVSAEIQMPHGKKQLSICDRDLIRTWIFKGAKDN
jgi:mono/diheme cytochrome c family protein